jgi:hypothetical protein
MTLVYNIKHKNQYSKLQLSNLFSIKIDCFENLNKFSKQVK